MCFLPIHSGHQVRWTYQPGSNRRKVTGFFTHLPSAVRALIFLARRIQPLFSSVDREVEFCVPLVGHFFFFFFSEKNTVYRDRTHVPTCQKVARLPPIPGRPVSNTNTHTKGQRNTIGRTALLYTTTLYLSILSTYPLHTNNECGREKKAQINWSMVMQRQHLLEVP